MISLGLSKAEQHLFHLALAQAHQIKITVQVLDLNHKYLADLSGALIDGQVDIDAWARVTRSCSLTLLDVSRSMNFDSSSPFDTALFQDRMIRVIYSVTSESLEAAGIGWVDVPIFTGPVTKMGRTDDVINVECQGKEVLAQTVAWNARTYSKGWKVTSIAKDIMRDFSGETRFTFPDWTTKTAKSFSIGKETIIWDSLRATVRGHHVFYDGRGVLRLRRSPKGAPLFTFKSGDGGSLTSYPQISYDADTVRNAVLIKGGIPVGSKTPLLYSLGAPASHPVSAEKLGRDGKRRILLEVVENDQIRSRAEARDLARSKLADVLMQTVDVAFDALVVPHLEPFDVCQVKTPEFSTTIRAEKLSIPLTAGGTMSVGYLSKRTAKNVRARRR